VSRPLSGLERVWLAADHRWPPFVNQLVVEGDGGLDAADWKRAIEQVLPAWPLARARLAGVLGWTRWEDDGPAPAVRVADEAWDGRGPTPCLDASLDARNGPVAEVVLVGGRLVIRTHHAAFDGGAAWAFAMDLAAAARGEAPVGAVFHDVRDNTIVGPGPRAVEPPADAPLPLDPRGTDTATTWRRRTLPRLRSPVLPRALRALRSAADQVSGPRCGALRISIPVDLRRGQARPLGANLTGFVRVDVAADASLGALEASLRLALDEARAAETVRAADPLRVLPLAWMAWAGGRAADATLRTGRASSSATFSNLGRQDVAPLRVPGFVPRRVFWIPPPGAGTPLFLTLTGHAEGVELCAGAPLALASDGRLDALLDALVDALLDARESTAPSFNPRDRSG
jgi:hypothetical protein